MNKSAAYLEGQQQALATFKCSMDIPSAMWGGAVSGGLAAPGAAIAGLVGGATAHKGDRISDALLTGTGSLAGGAAGLSAGSYAGRALGDLLSPKSHGIRQGKPGFRFGGGYTGALLGAAAGLIGGNVVGGILGHKANDALR